MELFTYLLKVSACMVLFFSIYLLVLRKLTFFKLNRYYLLGGLLLSFVIPTLQITIKREVETFLVRNDPAPSAATPVTLDTLPIVDSEELTAPFDWYIVLPYLYGGIALGLLLVAFWRLFQLFKHTRANTANVNGLKLVSKRVGFTNCSFFNFVFIDERTLDEQELQVLLRHEEVHARQLHSIDKILMMVAKAVLWFNPIVYLYDKALEEVHEYEADEATSRDFGTACYANLILKLAVSKNALPLVHNFAKSPIKQRIKMLFHKKSNHLQKLGYLFALPIGLVLIWGFTIKVVDTVPTVNVSERGSSDKKPMEMSTATGVIADGKLSLMPEKITAASSFLEDGGEIIHYYHAKANLQGGLLIAKEIRTDIKHHSLTGIDAEFKLNNGKMISGSSIVFDLKNKTYVVHKRMGDLAAHKPKLMSSESVRVDTKSDISYIKKGVIEIGGDRLEAEEIAWDSRNGLLTAKTGILKLANGKVVSDQYIIYDIKKRTYTTNSTPDNKIHVKSAAYQLLSKLTLTNDSIKVVKLMDIVALRADATINIDGYKLKGKLITCKENSNVITAHQAILTDKSGKVITAEELQFDVVTKKYTIIKN